MRLLNTHSRRALYTAFLFLLLGALAGTRAKAQTQELFRIRVTNAVGGAIEVSPDGGNSYVPVGKVVRPATALVPGFAASRWAAPGSVAATAVHGVRVRVRPPRGKEPRGAGETMMLSLVPREFHTVPKGYGGHVAGASGIYTDISCGEAIFRNLAPFVGNPVRLELEDRLVPFADDYLPRAGDRLVILVLQPPSLPREIIFENWKGGKVSAIFEGRDPQPIAQVIRPVLGVGRYDGTTYTGVGRVNTNHPGVITISTAGVTGFLLREGEGSERRGGIQIEPSTHAKAVSFNAPQVLVVGPLEGQDSLEGQPPLFSGYLGLFWDRRAPEHSLTVEVKIDNGAWEPMPEVLGRQDDAFTAPRLNDYFRRRGVERRITSGVTHLRLLFPRLGPELVARALEPHQPGAGSSPIPGVAASGNGAAPTRVRGVVTLNAELKNLVDPKQVAVMMIYVDGKVSAILNVTPFRHNLDTSRLTNGRHEVEMRALDPQGDILAQKKTMILVDNPVAMENGAG